MRALRWLRPWADWLLLVVTFVGLALLIYLAADIAYRRDHTVLYWFHIAWNYADGLIIFTVFGFAILMLALLADWVSLRLLARGGLAPWRALVLVALAILAGVAAVCTIVAGPLINDDSLLFSWAGALGFLALTLVLLALLALAVRGAWARVSAGKRPWLWLLGPVALTLAATLFAFSVTPVALIFGAGNTNYSHLASASYQDHAYYLTSARHISDGGDYVALYRCDAPGIWCNEIDRIGIDGDEQSETGHLRYDSATHTLTATEGDHTLLTYPTDTLFATP